MAILHSCCFWKSVRKGSFASAIYSLIYFGSSCVIVSIYLDEEHQYLSGEVEKPIGESFLEKEAISPTTVIFNILLLICASCGLLSSLLVIIGLKKDRRQFLMPWILFMSADLVIESSHFVYLVIIETLDFEPLTATLFTVDFFIMCLNVYCLLCVISQYQEYRAGRGYARHASQDNVRYVPPPVTTTCLNTFRQNQGATSPMMYPHTNFSVIPEETQLNGDSGNSGAAVTTTNLPALSKRRLNILGKKHVQFPDERKYKHRTDLTKEILADGNSNGRMLIESSQENYSTSWPPEQLKHMQSKNSSHDKK